MKMCYRRTVSVLSIEKHREAFSKTQHHPDSVSAIINMTEKTSTKRHFTNNRQKFPLLVALLLAFYFTAVLKRIFNVDLSPMTIFGCLTLIFKRIKGFTITWIFHHRTSIEDLPGRGEYLRKTPWQTWCEILLTNCQT